MPPSRAPAVSLGDVAAGILDAPLSSNQAAAPILARRRGPEKRLAEAKQEERDAAALARAKRALAGNAHKKLHEPSATNAALEKMLKKTATQGVVALFNAVRTAQKDTSKESSKDRKRKRQAQAVAETADSGQDAASSGLSKESFLDILRRGSQTGSSTRGKPPAAHDSEEGPSARFLRDDFMLGRHRAKDWEREDDEGDGGDVGNELDVRGAEFEED